MFELERSIYNTFRNKQIYDECCADGLVAEYMVKINAVLFAHMKGCGKRVLSAYLKESGWLLAFRASTNGSKHIALLWSGMPGQQTILENING